MRINRTEIWAFFLIYLVTSNRILVIYLKSVILFDHLKTPKMTKTLSQRIRMRQRQSGQLMEPGVVPGVAPDEKTVKMAQRIGTLGAN